MSSSLNLDKKKVALQSDRFNLILIKNCRVKDYDTQAKKVDFLIIFKGNPKNKI